jgi:hypothetical protein
VPGDDVSGCVVRPSLRTWDDRGIALIVVLMAMSVMTALGLALMLTTMAERKIAGNFDQAAEAFYAADAGIERAMQDLLPLPSWNGVLNGTVISTFVDGAPSGGRVGPGGTPFDLSEATSVVRCGKPACSNADLVAITEERPWSANNPVWQPFAYGRLDRLLAGQRINSLMYVVVWAADDPSENDGDPLRDGGLPVGCDQARDPGCQDRNPGQGVLLLKAKAFGPDGTQRAIEVTVKRTDRPRIASWRVAG